VFLIWGSQANATNKAFAVSWRHTGKELRLGIINDGDDPSLASILATRTNFDLDVGEHWFAMRVKVVNDPAIDDEVAHEVELWVDDTLLFNGTGVVRDLQVTDQLLGLRGAGVGGKSAAGFDINYRVGIYLDTTGSDMNGRLTDDYSMDSRKPTSQGNLNEMDGVPDNVNKYLNWDNLPKDCASYNHGDGLAVRSQDSNLEDAAPPAGQEVKAVTYYMTHLSVDCSNAWFTSLQGMLLNGTLVESSAPLDHDGVLTPLNHHFGTVSEATFNAALLGAKADSTDRAIHTIVADVLYGPTVATPAVAAVGPPVGAQVI